MHASILLVALVGGSSPAAPVVYTVPAYYPASVSVSYAPTASYASSVQTVSVPHSGSTGYGWATTHYPNYYGSVGSSCSGGRCR
jgi:hypothetical protein